MTDDQIKAHLRHIQDAAYLRDHEAAHIREDDLFISVLMGIRDGKIADPAKAAELALRSRSLCFPRRCA